MVAPKVAVTVTKLAVPTVAWLDIVLVVTLADGLVENLADAMGKQKVLKTAESLAEMTVALKVVWMALKLAVLKAA